MSIIVKPLWQFYKRHLAILILPFQPLLEDFDQLEAVRNRKYRHHYLFPFLLITSLMVTTIAQWYVYGNDPRNPVFYHHLKMKDTMPVMFLRQGDTLFGALYLLAFFNYAFCLFETFPHIDFVLFHEKKGPVWNLVLPYRKRNLAFVPRDLAKKLILFHRKLRKQITRLIPFLHSLCDIAFFYTLIILELYRLVVNYFRYVPPFRSIVVIVVCPLAFRVMVGGQYIAIQFLLQNAMIQVKQRHYYSKLATSNFRFRNPFNACLRMMSRIVDITKEINAFNSLYSKYISVVLTIFGVASCTVIYSISSKLDEAPVLQTTPWALYCVGYCGFIIFCTAFSSRLISCNMKLFKKLRRWQASLLLGGKLNRWQIVKLDLVNEYKLLLQKTSFRLLNSSTINNKLFAFNILPLITVLYMKIVSEDSDRK